MIKLELECEDVDYARVVLNAHSYLSLITDFTNQIRLARKHGGDVNQVIDNFFSDFYTATEHHNGPY
jgi:hypothetical protein